MMSLRCCIQHVSKSGRPSSGHRTGKGQSSSQFPRRVVLKNVLTIRQLHASLMLVRSCLKSCMLGFLGGASDKKPPCQCRRCKRHGINSWVRKISCRKDRLPTPVLGFSCGSASKESACNVGDLGLIPELGIFPAEGKEYPLQSCGLCWVFQIC